MTKQKSRKYHPITTKLCRKWLYKFIDRIHYGIWDPKLESPRFAYETATVQARGIFGSWLKKVTMSDIDLHLTSGKIEDTLYYTTWAGSDQALLCLDIDAHEGQTNAQDVANWIKSNYFPDAYMEPSTHGLGVHLYILVWIKARGHPLKRKEFNAYAEDFARKLKELVQDEFGPDSAIAESVRGTVTYTASEGDVKRGDLAKIPRPQTLEDVQALQTMPVYSLLDLRRVVYDLNVRVATKQWQPGVQRDPKDTGDRSREIPVPSKKTTSGKEPQSLHDKLYHENPSVRVFKATCEMIRDLKRKPTVEEVHAFYQSMGLHTGDDIKGRRIKRIRQAIEKCWKEYDEALAKRSYDIQSYTPGRSLDVLKARLTAKDLTSTNYRRRIRYEDLDLFVDVIADAVIHDNVGNEHWFGTVSAQYLKNAFQAAKKRKLLKSKADDSKVAAMRQLCVQAGLIDMVDANWVHLGSLRGKKGKAVVLGDTNEKGRAMKYALTSLHPRYNEYEQAKRQHEAILARQSSQKKAQ